MESVHEVVAGNPYPGRGVVWARTLDGALCGGYFLTGRSPASRTRTVRRGDGELIVAPTAAPAAPAGPGGPGAPGAPGVPGVPGAPAHDPLRHYVAARERDGWLVFGNGEQVATVSDRLRRGHAPAEALSGLEYEPDPPIFTPRITVVADVRDDAGDDARDDTRPGREAWFGAARRGRGGRTAADVLTLAVRDLEPGDAVLMTTYRSDGRTVATGEPYHEVRTEAAGRDGLLEELWSALDPRLRVAAAVFEPHRTAEAAVRHEIVPGPGSGP
ncbi:IMP cyclohydrolase [Streptomyces albiaxialis]|uniref:IMP cyclohydrolase n=1 Tax=Streptomyces albiaxialis TaxID=329523 RepID=UPI0031D01A72